MFFWILLGLSGYSYFIYPAILMLLKRHRSVPNLTSAEGLEHPRVSIIVAVHNEELRLPTKIQNTLAIDYPRDRLEFIVASDASTDMTNTVAADCRELQLVVSNDRMGKEHAQKLAIESASGDILVFSDVATIVPPTSITRLVAILRNPMIGAVSSEDRFVTEDGKVAGEGLYVKYEMWLRSLESRCAGLVGLSGSFFCARKSVCENWDTSSPSDFNTALSCARKGLIAVSDPEVIGLYSDVKEQSAEYRRKVRTIVRGMTALSRNLDALAFTKHPLFSFQLFSHKIMRWLVPWFLAMLLLVSLSKCDDSAFFKVATVMQLAFYGTGLLAWVMPSLRRISIARVIYYFLQVNVAVAHATVLFVSGKRFDTWTPTSR